MPRDASIGDRSRLGIEGGCKSSSLDPEFFQHYVIEVNPRARASALASATGHPIAKIAAKIAVGLT